MVAIVFMHVGSALDGEKKHSSFAHAVFTFRKRSGRESALDQRLDRFEKVFIGLFDPDDITNGGVGFFDVARKPPRNGLPKALMSLRDVVDDVERLVRERNDLVFEYEDGDNLDGEVDLGLLSATDLAGSVVESDEDS
jgi:hypothetical protein